jgi:cellulose synthase operon protein C
LKALGRRLSIAGTWLMLITLLACRPASAQTVEQAEAALRAGRYDEAIAGFRRLAAANPAPAGAHRGLVRALAETGRFEEAENVAAALAPGSPAAVEVSASLGEVLYARGKLAEAETAFRRARETSAPDSLWARVQLAMLRHERGDRDGAAEEFDAFIDIYNARAQQLTAQELMAVGLACWYLGTGNSGLIRDALKAFDLAAAKDPTWAEPRLRAGALFLEKYNSPDAQASFDEVLEMNPRNARALHGSARRRNFEGAPGADSLARLALEHNPGLVDARVLVAEILLGLESYDEATKEIDLALAVDSTSPGALAVLAGIRYLSGDERGYQELRTRALARNPRDAAFFTTVAELSARNRFYREATAFAAEGVALDSSAPVLTHLGMNQLRTGDMSGGRASLEAAFTLDPFNVWVKNTLDMLDTFDQYSALPTPRFRLVADPTEAELLALYAMPLAEEAFERFSRRYNYTPTESIRVELFRRSEDFSVRTVGLAGIGALGVSFGPVVALDAPSARPVGQFNWGSTLWHELAHTFTLGASGHRVPRWFSEGLSVYEERRARPGWGAGVTPGFLVAFREKRLVPVSRMNDGFVRPTYPEQVLHSYYQASLVCEMIAKEFGEATLTRMLDAYRDGHSTEEVFRRVLRLEPAAIDSRFDAYVQETFAGPLASLRPVMRAITPPPRTNVRETPDEFRRRADVDHGDFGAQLNAGRALMEARRFDDAALYLERARNLFPEYAGSDSPALLLAVMHRERGDKAAAARELKWFTEHNETSYEALITYADLLTELGDSAGTAAALEKSMYINPYDAAVHVRLAQLYSALGDRAKAVRERHAVVALRPVDMAGALYELALAQQQAGDRTSARRTVLRALEEAPNFEKAQLLLLELRG